MWQIWLIAAGIFFIIEIATAGFLIFWLAIAAVITMICSLVISNVYIQFAIFVITSTILIIATKPFVNKFVNKGVEETKSNAFSIVGKKAIVTKSINSVEGIGQIKVNGEVWSAKSLEEINFEEGTEVEVVSIEGVKAIVKIAKKETVNV